MSLKEAILDIAKEMDANAADSIFKEEQLRWLMHGFAKQLQTAVKAAGDAPANNQAMGNAPLAQHAVEIEKARAEFRQKKLEQENGEPNMTLLVGGAADGSWIPTDPAMPIGARTNINGDVYKLDKDGKLYHEPQPAVLRS